ncbi:MAG: ion transporter [Gammaproteobacteria bacterium]|nr:ion transporter [Gammaproteobacteria bacterium]MBT4606086.1 ion transporter [Thiotrichales bacterium]MBT3471861.1 ion transporter [Gammaproteobacteria bacterium]MBT3967108.1 ion transporter [Gammaproteobacteria bacterium]MBT4082004.1 ion transporter [Gammaproteobacteria bacterium]
MIAVSSLETFQLKLESLQQNKWFESAVILIIVISALTIGAKTYNLSPELTQALVWLDIGVTLFFVMEIALRMLAARHLPSFFRSGWNLFDFTIVVASLVPLEDSELVLLARLLRIFRVLRLVSLIPELRLLINALLKAIPRMGYVVLLMFVIFYIYGAVGSILFEQINNVLWGDVAISMLTLFRIATFEDWTDVMYETMAVYPLSWIYYLSFIFLTTFVFLNMMVGIVLDVLTREHQRFDQESGEGEAGEVHWIREHTEAIETRLGRIEQLLKER